MVTEHVRELAKPNEVAGSIQYRDEAEDGQQLWFLSGHLRDAFDDSEGDKVELVNYVLDVAKKATEIEVPKCKFLCRPSKR